jgi:hypothetical protein
VQIIVAFVVLPLLAICLLTAHCEGAFWSGRKRAFERFARDQGLRVDSKEDCSTARGELEGHSFEMSLAFRSGKEAHYQLKTSLSLRDCPLDLKLSKEGLITGLKRTVGREEFILGDEEVDTAFWIQAAGPEEARNYIVSPRREALLRFLTRLPWGGLTAGKITSTKTLWLPLFGERLFRKTHRCMALLADGLCGKGRLMAELPPERFSVLQRVLMRSIPGTLITMIFLLIFGSQTPEMAGEVIKGSAWVGIMIASLAFISGRVGRLLLQGYYAFLTIAIGIFTLLFSFKIAQFPVSDDDRWITILMSLIAAFLCWAMRHYLRGLVPVRKSSPEEQAEAVNL